MSKIVVPSFMLPTPVEADRIDHVGGAVVQHGSLSDRVYLLKPGASVEVDLALMETAHRYVLKTGFEVQRTGNRHSSRQDIRSKHEYRRCSRAGPDLLLPHPDPGDGSSASPTNR